MSGIKSFCHYKIALAKGVWDVHLSFSGLGILKLQGLIFDKMFAKYSKLKPNLMCY